MAPGGHPPRSGAASHAVHEPLAPLAGSGDGSAEGPVPTSRPCSSPDPPPLPSGALAAPGPGAPCASGACSEVSSSAAGALGAPERVSTAGSSGSGSGSSPQQSPVSPEAQALRAAMDAPFTLTEVRSATCCWGDSFARHSCPPHRRSYVSSSASRVNVKPKEGGAEGAALLDASGGVDNAAAAGDSHGHVGIERPRCRQPAGADAGLGQVCPQPILGHGVKDLLEIDKADPQLRAAGGAVAVLQRAQHEVCV